MKVKIKISKADSNGHVNKSNDQVEISIPLKYFSNTKFGGFSMNANGNGKYFGPNQNWGGPVSGDLVLFENCENPYFAYITSWTQDWTVRECKLIFICFKHELIERVIDGIKEEPQDTSIVLKHLIPIIGFDKAVDVCFDLTKKKLYSEIEKIKY